MHQRQIRGKKAQRGFTIAELMAVVVLSSLSITFIYYLFIDQSRLARIQAEIGDLQTSLQFSVASIQRDLRRTGYMSIVTNTDKRLCSTIAHQEFNSIRYFDGDTKYSFATKIGTTNVNKFIRPDRIELFGNFTTTTDFPAYIDPSKPDEVIIDFAGSSIRSQSAFEQAFYSPNQLAAVKGQTGRLQIIQFQTGTAVASVYNAALNRATLKVTSNLPLNNSADCGIAIRFRIAPLHKIQYRIKLTDPVPPATTADPYVWELVREVLDPGRCNPTTGCGGWTPLTSTSPHPPLNIAPNAVDIQFWFGSWNPTTQQMEHSDPRCLTDNVSSCLAANKGVTGIHDDTTPHWPADPSNIRSVFFRVTARSENEDPSMIFIPRKSLQTDILRTFDLNPNQRGAARVRSVVKNVMLPNMLAK